MINEFSESIARRMRAEYRTLAGRWFERLLALLPVDASDVFPTESLLDHIPALILEISDYIRRPDENAIAANTAILDKARELGELRYAQRASLHQLLREYQILGGILVTFVTEEVEEVEEAGMAPSAVESAHVVSRVHQAVNVLSQATVEAFVTLYTQTIAEQSARLEQFTRMVSHEWRQPLSALQFGIGVLRQPEVDSARTTRTLELVERNVRHLVNLTNTLETIARMNAAGDNPVVQEVSIRQVAIEAARQLREMADAQAVDLRIAEDLPMLVTDVGRIELALVNLLSNAIKYSDPTKDERFVEVTGGRQDEQAWELIVRDNGIGIPSDALAGIFRRFTRAHAQREQMLHVGGVGLGLSIVDDCVRAMNGEIRVESCEGVGTTFVVTLPVVPLAVAGGAE